MMINHYTMHVDKAEGLFLIVASLDSIAVLVVTSENKDFGTDSGGRLGAGAVIY